jgi:UDP-3-O-[3-hydroxymyristoyl] glucosamine N-acyltransferase
MVVELPPDRIADVDVKELAGRSPAELEAFAAVGLHALNHARADLCTKLAQAGYSLATLVHPRAVIDASAGVAPNVLIDAYASVGPDSTIGFGSVVLEGARVEAGARVESFAWVSANVVIGFAASVGDHTILRSGVNLDAGVTVGNHCELATSGLRQTAIDNCTFETPAFERPVRIYRGGSSR